MTHRGPNDWGEWTDGNLYMGHRRLSIIDLSPLGRQPMHDADATVIGTVNGEIYNHRELRSVLGSQNFRSASDSEVVVHGYCRWGLEGLLRRLEGMYAIALWDRHRQQLHLIRDRVGIKPLYYGEVGGAFCWSSELKAIAEYFGAALSVDYTAVYDYLSYRYVPAPKSLYRGILKLPQGSACTFEPGRHAVRCRRYWSLPRESEGRDGRDGDALRGLLTDAAASHLLSDVPVGVFLSGGVDSSLVAALALEQQQGLGSFCLGFTQPAKDESEDAAAVAASLGSRHHSSRAGPEDIAGAAWRLREVFDEPFADSSAMSTLLLCEMAARDVRVALSGDGGDELFAGYPWHHRPVAARARWLQFLARSAFSVSALPSGDTALRRLVRRLQRRHLVFDPFELRVLENRGMLAAEKRCYRCFWGIPADYDDYWHFREHYHQDLPALSRWQHLDFNTFLVDDILTKVDRASMRYSLEVRVPLLATSLVEWVFALAEAARVPGGQPKALLRREASHWVPERCFSKPKKGFGSPVKALRRRLAPGSAFWTETVLRTSYSDLDLPGKGDRARAD